MNQKLKGKHNFNAVIFGIIYDPTTGKEKTTLKLRHYAKGKEPEEYKYTFDKIVYCNIGGEVKVKIENGNMKVLSLNKNYKG